MISDTKQALEQLLSSLGESNAFAASGSLSPVSPGLEVAGIGLIGVPISEADARRLITRATQAPYGWGEETITDTDVRRVWQIDPSIFSLQNPEWAAYLASIVEAVKHQFATESPVTTELYKLLVYEKGDFFSLHRDTEKTSGMFATLVVGLPSRHEGGTLTVKQNGHSQVFDFGGPDSDTRTHYVAFYADCQHEIAPVTEGHRVCLVYNLAFTGDTLASTPKASLVESAALLLKGLLADPKSRLDKVAIPLQHHYTEAGLDPRQLKGVDRIQANVVMNAAALLNYPCHLALVSLRQTSAADEADWDGSEGEIPVSEMGEIYDEQFSLDCWFDAEARAQPFGKIALERDEVLTLDGKEGWSIRQDISGATGNQGVAMNRWYRQAALVVWPRTRHFKILARGGQSSAIPVLERILDAGDTKAARAFATQIINQWRALEKVVDEYECDEDGESLPVDSYSRQMVPLLARIGNVPLAQKFVRTILPQDHFGTEGEALRQLCERFGWEKFAEPLRDFFENANHSETHVEHLWAICRVLCVKPPEMSEVRRRVCQSLVERLAQAVEFAHSEVKESWRLGKTDRSGFLANVVLSFAAVSANPHLDRFLELVLSDPLGYDLYDFLIPEVRLLHAGVSECPQARAAADRLLEHCTAILREATAVPVEAPDTPPQPPKDWAREPKLECSCKVCQIMNGFLQDPKDRGGVYKFSVKGRQHLYQEIDKHRCDMLRKTIFSSGRYLFECTKTFGALDRRLKEFDRDSKLLAELESMARID